MKPSLGLFFFFLQAGFVCVCSHVDTIILLLSLERPSCQKERQRSAFLFLVPAQNANEIHMQRQRRTINRATDTVQKHCHQY